MTSEKCTVYAIVLGNIQYLVLKTFNILTDWVQYLVLDWLIGGISNLLD